MPKWNPKVGKKPAAIALVASTAVIAGVYHEGVRRKEEEMQKRARNADINAMAPQTREEIEKLEYPVKDANTAYARFAPSYSKKAIAQLVKAAIVPSTKTGLEIDEFLKKVHENAFVPRSGLAKAKDESTREVLAYVHSPGNREAMRIVRAIERSARRSEFHAELNPLLRKRRK